MRQRPLGQRVPHPWGHHCMDPDARAGWNMLHHLPVGEQTHSFASASLLSASSATCLLNKVSPIKAERVPACQLDPPYMAPDLFYQPLELWEAAETHELWLEGMARLAAQK